MMIEPSEFRGCSLWRHNVARALTRAIAPEKSRFGASGWIERRHPRNDSSENARSLQGSDERLNLTPAASRGDRARTPHDTPERSPAAADPLPPLARARGAQRAPRAADRGSLD